MRDSIARALPLLFLVSVLGWSGHGAADTRTPAIKAAKIVYDKGIVAYRLRDFDEAIGHFREAYRMSGHRNCLNNIAMSYRAKQDFENALRFYRATLYETAATDIEERKDLERVIGELEEILAARQLASEAPPNTPKPLAGVKPPEVSVPPTNGPPAGRPQWPWVAGGTFVATGLALVVTGGWLSIRASAAAGEINDAAQSGRPFTAELAEVDRNGRRDATLGAIALGVGAAAIVTGGVCFYLGIKGSRPERTRIVPTASARGFGLAVEVKY
jgi:tetratricopeptide (TPR) repeat protein